MKLFRLRKSRAVPENTEEMRRKALQNEFKSAFGADLEDMTRRAANRRSPFQSSKRAGTGRLANAFSIAAE